MKDLERRIRSRLARASIGALAATLSLGACHASGPRAGTGVPSSTATSTAAESSTTTAPPAQTSGATTSTTNPSTTSSAPSSPGTCDTAHLTITAKGIDARLGHQNSVVLFQNTGRPCLLRGYPGLDGIDANGKVVVSAQRAPATTERTVQLNTGQTASAPFEGHIGPVPAQGPCPAYAALLVTPPNETHSVRIPSNFSLCYLLIHPVVRGLTGDANSG
ncbi:MAG: DUF4232 domain-containing protein [Actinomycetota bacterium]|nr:DUF4232 domain-containing protein [Actinomycetota bacterium]MDQ6948329.1 DUF4232 domain-containing protein [Actinomycetota bacterium]